MILLKLAMNWWKDLKIKIKLQEPMKEHTFFKIGGPAKYFVEPKDGPELKSLLSSIKRYNMPLLVIGGGSNILVNDKGLRAIVLCLNSPIFKKISFQGNHVFVASGASLSQVLRLAQKQGLSGLEFLSGIPGRVGGALAMNAGIPEKNIGDLVEEVSVIDYNGNIKNLNKKEIKFGYRTSNFSKYIILSARLRLIKKDKQEIKNRIKRYLNHRKLTQDLSWSSAGCIFKNPKGVSAGKLIDLCGLKGKRIGGACISRIHANFILNLGHARARDVLKLMDLAKKEVKKKFNVSLEPEIKIWK